MLLYIVRHGETEWNVAGKTQGAQDIGLTDKGREQAQKLAKRLQNEPIHKIFCSHLKRAEETAFIIGKEIGRECISTPLLREACFGRWEGYTINEIENMFPGQLSLWYQDTDFCPLDGESMNCVRQRVLKFIEEIRVLKLDGTQGILIVSHALTCKILILELMGLPLSYVRKIKQDNTGLTIIKALHEESVLILLNDICHLKGCL